MSGRLNKDKIQCQKCAKARETCSKAEAVRKGGGSAGKRSERVQKHCSGWKMTERVRKEVERMRKGVERVQSMWEKYRK